MTTADIMALPLKSGRPGHAEAAEAASIINDALAETLHIATTEPSGSVSSHAEWCAAVGTSAHDLAVALSSVTPDDGNAPWDAFRLLEPGLLQESNDAQTQRLRVLLMDAVPTTQPPTTDELFLSALARLAPGLRALNLLALQAEEYWTDSIRRGGSTPDRARRHLIARFADVYETLSGTAPTVITKYKGTSGRTHQPSGPALDWFAGLFVLVEGRLPDTSRVAPLRTIVSSGCKGSDTVAHWLRGFGKQRKSTPSSTD